MPDDKFTFKPTPAQRTFAEQVMHIATIDVALFGTLSALNGVIPPASNRGGV